MAIPNKQDKASRRRIKRAAKATKRWDKGISQAERSLLDSVISKYLLKYLKIDEKGNLVKTIANYASTSFLDDIWKKVFVQDHGKALIKQYLKDTTSQFDAVASYFDTVTGDVPKETVSEIKSSLFKTLGYDVSKKAIHPSGTLSLILRDRSPLESIKGIVHQSVASGVSLSDLEGGLRTRIVTEGILKGFFAERIPDPADRFDRMASQAFGDTLGLKYVVYQGGLITTSRPFCKIRDGKVFTLEEIHNFGTPQDKYGGYTNKSAGEFQGKTKMYVPERDLGGYNCRHHLDYITEKLAFQLRPDLKTKR